MLELIKASVRDFMDDDCTTMAAALSYYTVFSLPPLLVLILLLVGAVMDPQDVQGSLEISRALDQAIAERPLFPPEPFARRSVEDAERWGHDELQPIPRRIFRRAVVRDRALRRWVAADVAGVPAPALMAALTKPVAARRSAESGGDEATIRADVGRLPGLLDHVDALVGAGVIGTDQPNAADFQILSSVRVLLDFKALPAAEDRPSAQRARRLFPYWEGEMPYFELP